VEECASRLKVTVSHFLGFALVLLSMFFFFVERCARTLIARCTFVAMSARSFLCFAHGPPITQLPGVVSPHRTLLGRRRVHRV
jgi:hypothetical protein